MISSSSAFTGFGARYEPHRPAVFFRRSTSLPGSFPSAISDPSRNARNRHWRHSKRIPCRSNSANSGARSCTAPARARNPRRFEGSGQKTKKTPRPAWYPALAQKKRAPANALPDGKMIYPLAQRAMKSFEDGGTGFETSRGSWRIAARPASAWKEKCVACHNIPAFGTGMPAVLNQALGCVLYAFRSPSHLPLAAEPF